MYSDICLIGLGTLGGFLAKNLYELDTTKNLLLIDYDKVEEKNIINSIYNKEDVGNFKTESVYKKLHGQNVNVNIINEKFIENITNIPRQDLIIDCRDITYQRGNLIDVRLYISFRNLIIDCRKNVDYQKQHEGKYITRLNKTELKSAALNATLLINNGIFKQLIEKQKVQEIPIDGISEHVKARICKNDDIIHDYDSFGEKLINLNDNYSSIIDLNKENEMTVCLGYKNLPYNTKVFPTNNFNSINDIISKFSLVTKNIPYEFNYYIVTVNKYNNKYYIELLPETGSA